jgi:DNA mismatch repair protein MutS
MFATHYHELVPHTEALATVSVVQTEVMEQNGRVIFTHRLKPGASGSSFGIEVARIAGLPEPVIAAALEHLAQSQDAAAPAAPAGRPRRVEGATGGVQQPALARFGVQEQSRGALERLARLDLNRLTPIQALNFLAEIQQSLMPVKQPRLFPEETS